MLIILFKKIRGKEWDDMQTKITEKQKKPLKKPQHKPKRFSKLQRNRMLQM